MYQQNPQLNQPAAPAEPRQCFKCNYQTVSNAARCPRCHSSKFLNERAVRIRGGVLVGVGLFLVVLMGGIAVFVGMLLFSVANDPANAKKLINESGALLGVAALFAGVIAFGINSIVSGLWMWVFGRRNRVLVWVMWALLALIIAAGVFFRVVAK